MKEKATIMRKEIRAVANHRALIVSKSILSAALLIASLYLGILRFPLSPIYILLILNALPAILSFAANDFGKKSQNIILHNIIKDSPFQLGTLKMKYKYTKLRYVSNSVSYLISLILIGLWQYNYSRQHYLPNYLKFLPIFLLASSILIRLIGMWIYPLKFRYDISHNKVR